MALFLSSPHIIFCPYAAFNKHPFQLSEIGEVSDLFIRSL